MPPRPLALSACTLLLALFTALAWTAARGKSPIVDEPLHVTAAWTYRYLDDFRLNPEHPPLWKRLAALAECADALHPDTTSPAWRDAASLTSGPWTFARDSLFHTPGVDGDAVVQRARRVMLILGVLLGALTAACAGRLAGPLAAVIAAFLFALDPNLLAHATLVTNDVSLSLFALAAMAATWALGERITLPRLLAAAFATAAALATKFTGLLLLPTLAVLLSTRALLPTPWHWRNSSLTSRPHRLLASVVLFTTILLVSWLGLWAVYNFRFAPSAADPSVSFDPAPALHDAAISQLLAVHPGAPVTTAELADWQPDRFSRLLLWTAAHHLLPQAYPIGLLYVHCREFTGTNYLLNQYSPSGWWYYFPVTALIKTPTATLLALLTALALCIFSPLHHSTTPPPHHSPPHPLTPSLSTPSPPLWLPLCLATFPTLLLLALSAGHLQIGLRHLLPAYPFLFIATAITLSQLKKKQSIIALPLLALGLAAETVLAYPNFIPFFNAPAVALSALHSPAPRLTLLGDSNLDWGQDLKLLAAWQRAHPSEKLYLAYFGQADPAFYGIRYTRLPGGLNPNPADPALAVQKPHAPGVLAISATCLQGIFFEPNLRALYADLYTHHRPREILGQSIYLYDFPFDDSATPAPSTRPSD